MEIPKYKSKYFLLSKNGEDEILDSKNDQLFFINQDKVMLISREYLSHHSIYGLYECSLMTWIKQEFSSKDKYFIDIGAHTGTFAITLSNYFKHVYAFEPQRQTYYALCGGIALSNIENATCINVALGSPEQCATGSAVLHINSPDGGTSSIIPSHTLPTIREEIVSIRTLDDYENVFKDKIGAIKIDVEKNELNVLKGAIRCLKNSNNPYIFFEAEAPAPHHPLNNTSKELFDFLHEIGYKTSKINSYENMYIAVGEP
jgi:FkbM family methyltransferase